MSHEFIEPNLIIDQAVHMLNPNLKRCPDCDTFFDLGPAHVCQVSGGTRCGVCWDRCPDNEVEGDICIDCYEKQHPYTEGDRAFDTWAGMGDG